MTNENINLKLIHDLNSIDQEDFMLIKQAIKRKNELLNTNCKPLKFTSFECVKINLVNYIKDAKYLQVIQLILKENDNHTELDEIKKISNSDLLSFLFWIMDELEAINQVEKELFNTPPTSEELEAGINNFNQFGVINTIDALAGGDILKWEKIVKLSYFDVLNKLYKNQVTNNFQQAYSKVLMRKNKIKR
ncbi:hypothetical protein ETU10_08495 [Apibacter muscae]|uniref:hypothetical protein n=1 Tax=Apibacter muscae TaxID=2509004 RepID=UPI0011ABADB4|nr:hypothetical protein [Apibacter muscae]TWP23125.1 hypothetical protein ETU10_08495 [Apibacter muscae]